MQRLFPLNGLMRLRHLEQDRAASELAAANADVHLNDLRRAETRDSLTNTTAAATDSRSMHALAASRASSRSMLAELDALGRIHQTAAEQAQEAFNAARAGSIALEKLEERHTEAFEAEELRTEQTALDEIASTRWFRDQNGAKE